jgi:hypothetical protein
MERPQAAIVGSVDESRVFDPPVPDPAGARRACEELGRELAVAEWQLVVYSVKPKFVEADVVRGYVESGKATSKSIHLHAPIGKGSFVEYAEQPDLFDVRPDPSGDWEVSFYRSLSGCDGVILLGGGRSTLITGLIALTMRLPVLAVAAFGGNARKVWERLSGETGQSEADRDEMGNPWEDSSAAQLVQNLERQRQQRLERERTEARRERTEARRANTSLTVAVILLLAAVAGLVLSCGSRPGSAGSIALLALVPMLAAAGGALIRTSLDVGRDWTRAGVLGGAAGLITGLLYVASQLVGSPTVLDPGQTAAVRRLLFFVLPIGFVAGLTFDAVYPKLRGTNVSQADTLGKL